MTNLFIGLVFLVSALSLSADAALSNAASHRNYVRRAHAQINNLSREMQNVEKNLRHVDSNKRAECEELLGHLWKKEKLARVRLQAIRNASDERWLSLRKQEDALLVHLQKSYQYLMNHYFK